MVGFLKRKRRLLLIVCVVGAVVLGVGCCIPHHSVIEEGGRTVEIVLPDDVPDATPRVFCRVFDRIDSHSGILGRLTFETRSFEEVPLERNVLRTSPQDTWHLGHYLILSSEFRKSWCEYVFYARGAQTGRWTATGAEGKRFRATLQPAESVEDRERAVDEFLGMSKYRFYGLSEWFWYRDRPLAVPWRKVSAEATAFAVREYRWCLGQCTDEALKERIQMRIDCLLGKVVPVDPRELWPSLPSSWGGGLDRDTPYADWSFPYKEQEPGYVSGMTLERLE